MGHRHFIVALSDQEGAGTWFLPRVADVSGASLYVENSVHDAGDNLVARPIATARLDAWLKSSVCLHPTSSSSTCRAPSST